MAVPSVQQLRYAVAVAEARNFGRAARRCFVSQPALSAQIKELEERLGVQVFERTSHGVLVTAVGAEVIERSRRILREVDDLSEAVAGSGALMDRPLRLGVIPTIAPYVLPLIMRSLRETRPGLPIYLREDRTHPLVEQLLAGELDVLLLALPLEQPGLTALVLYDEPFLLAVPEVHPLASGRICDVAALAGERLVLLEEGHCLRDQALAVCDQAGASGRPEVQGTSLATVVQMVGAGVGVTLLPVSAVARDVHPGTGIVVRELGQPVPARTVGLAWRSSSARGAEYRRLGAIIAAAGRDAMATGWALVD